MKGRQYLKNQLPLILINLLGMLALALSLTVSGTPVSSILFIFFVWLLVLVLCLLSFYFSRKKYLNQLLDMTEQLEEHICCRKLCICRQGPMIRFSTGL